MDLMFVSNEHCGGDGDLTVSDSASSCNDESVIVQNITTDMGSTGNLNTNTSDVEDMDRDIYITASEEAGKSNHNVFIANVLP